MSVRSDFGRLHWDVSCDFDGEEDEGGGGGWWSVERGAWSVERGAWSVERVTVPPLFQILYFGR